MPLRVILAIGIGSGSLAMAACSSSNSGMPNSGVASDGGGRVSESGAAADVANRQPPMAFEAGVTCDPSPRGAFPTIVTPSGVYLGEGIPADIPQPLSTTAFIGRKADGSLDPSSCMSASSVTVPVAEYAMGTARVANSVYLLGGVTTGATTLPGVYRAEIANGGLTSFHVATLQGVAGTPVALQVSRYGAEVVQTQNYVYVISGWSSTGGDLTEIERAQVDPTTGDFVTNFAPAIDPSTGSPATLAVPRFDTVAFNQGSSVCVLGGQTGVGGAATFHNEIQHATLDASGNLSSFRQVGTLPTNLAGPGIYVAGGTLYLLGGGTSINYPSLVPTSAVLQAPIAIDGTLGAFTTSSVTLPYPIFYAGEAVLGKTVYLIGGFGLPTGFNATDAIEAISFP